MWGNSDGHWSRYNGCRCDDRCRWEGDPDGRCDGHRSGEGGRLDLDDGCRCWAQVTPGSRSRGITFEFGGLFERLATSVSCGCLLAVLFQRRVCLVSYEQGPWPTFLGPWLS